MSQENWYRCDGCEAFVQFDYRQGEPRESTFKDWLSVDLKIGRLGAGTFQSTEHRYTCCSTACVGRFLEQHAKDFEGDVSLFAETAEPKKARK